MLFDLQDEELARQLVELGYRGSGEVLKREEFEARKAAAEASRLSKRSQQKWVVLVFNLTLNLKELLGGLGMVSCKMCCLD